MGLNGADVRIKAMNVPLFLAGLLAVVGAGIHGLGGERWVLRKLWHEPLPPTRLGGPRMTKAMVHVSWHLATFAFLAAGIGMVVTASVLDGDAAEALGIFTAATFTGFAAIALGVGGAGNPRAVLRHGGPLVLSAAAALAWWGAL